MQNGLILAALAALVATPAAAEDFTVTGPYAIPASGTLGGTSPYPIPIVVSGLAGVITDVNFTLTGFSHQYPADLEVLLTGPTGASVVLMRGAGGGFPVSNVTFTFDQQSANILANVPSSSNSYRPTDNYPGFGITGIAGPYGSSLNVFNGLAANGTWNLYINDALVGDSGSVRALTLSILTSGAASAVPEPATWAMLLIGFSALGVALRRRPTVAVRFG